MTIFPQNLCGIGRDGNVGVPALMFDRWANLGNLGGWTLRSLATAPNGWIYGVGTAGNVGIWSLGGWQTHDAPNGWTLKSLAWGPDGTLWCVGANGNVGIWRNNQWVDQGNLGGWTLKMLAFDSMGGKYGVGTDGNIGRWVDDAVGRFRL